MLIRRMDLGDIEEVVKLEHDLFSSPWNEEAFKYELICTTRLISSCRPITGSS